MVAVQGTFDLIGGDLYGGEPIGGDLSGAAWAQPLSEVTFVVVDLETTGGSATDDAITEVGAVKVRGGEVLGEFQTLVAPGRPVPPNITALTGISNGMLRDAPSISAVLPAFLEFARGSVLVAHNAGFDIGFLKAAAARAHLAWPRFVVADTVLMARSLLARGETRNVKLATLAAHFGSPTTPTHRALDDARATVHVLHALIERGGTLGVHRLDDLGLLRRRVPAAVRRKTALADGLPESPGVYLFRDDDGRVLYVGTSRNLRRRVRSYFTAAEQRSRVRQMVRLAASVTPVPCPTPLEAHVREIRLIAEHRPPYNQRSKAPERTAWVRLTDEAFPRLSIVRAPRGDDAAIGPFRSRADAQAAVDALHEAFPIRQCTTRLSRTRRSPACLLADLGRCSAPCDLRDDVDDYAFVVGAVREAMLVDPRPVIDAVHQRLQKLTHDQRYEDAAQVRDGLLSLLTASSVAVQLRALAACPLFAAAAPSEVVPGEWELIVVRHGVLAATASVPTGPRIRPALDALVATAPSIEPGGHGLPIGHIHEALAVLKWLDRPGVRPAIIDGTWAWPAHCATAHLRPYLGRSSDPYRRRVEASIQRSSTFAAAPSSIA